MTTIAYRDGVMASDSGAIGAGNVAAMGAMHAGAGATAAIEAAVAHAAGAVGPPQFVAFMSEALSPAA